MDIGLSGSYTATNPTKGLLHLRFFDRQQLGCGIRPVAHRMTRNMQDVFIVNPDNLSQVGEVVSRSHTAVAELAEDRLSDHPPSALLATEPYHLETAEIH